MKNHLGLNSLRVLLSVMLFLNIHCSNNNSHSGKKPPGSVINTNALKFLDRGDFILQFGQENPENTLILQQLNRNGLLSNMIGQLNDYFRLPYNVPIIFQSIGKPNAFYDPGTRSIRFGVEFVKLFINLFSREYPTYGEALAEARHAVYFFLFHELGHALVDIYDIKTHGNGEDVADNFSIYLLTTGNEEAADAALDGASYFQIATKYESEMKLSELPVLDEHAIDPQRYFQIVCKVYASNPQRFRYIIDQGYLDPEKTGYCADEYQREKSAWDEDLARWTQ